MVSLATRSNKRVAVLRFLFLSLCLLLSPHLFAAPPAAKADLDRIVAVVDDDLVMYSELQAKIKQATLGMRGAQLPPRSVIEQKVLDQLIDRRVQLNAARQAGIVADEGTIAKAIAGIAERNKLTLPQFRTALERSGINYNQFKQGIEEEFLVNRMLSQNVLNKIQVSDQEIAAQLGKNKGKGGGALINQTHVRHILLRTDEITSDQDAKTRLAQLRTRLVGGDDFAALAKSHSKDTASAIKGGDLGWLGATDVLPVFRQEMDALKPNEISQPFQTQLGWHLIQVLERRTHDNSSEQEREQIKSTIQQRKAEEAIKQYVRRLRDEAYVEIRLSQPDKE